jgi:hypothetical protein
MCINQTSVNGEIDFLLDDSAGWLQFNMSKSHFKTNI